LAGLFWGDRLESKARRSLATALWHIRRCWEVVQAELRAEPVAETTELYQAILERRFAVGRAPKVFPVQIPAMGPLMPPGRSPLDVIALSPLVG
jgi:hypothetical protein